AGGKKRNPGFSQVLFDSKRSVSRKMRGANLRRTAASDQRKLWGLHMRWTWIDRFTSFESRRSATAVKCLSLAEDHFADHFPGFPVMPAPLILEGLAQTGGILVGEANQYRENVVLAKMSSKFHREAMAGEQLTYTATIVDINETG